MSDGSRFTHHFSGVKGLSEDEANQLVEVLRTGSQSEQAAARERLISGSGPMVISLVSRHVRHEPRDKYLSDDLVSVAMLEVIRVVDKLKTNKSDHALATLANAVRFAIRKVSSANGLGISAITRSRQRKAGVTLPGFVEVDPKDVPEPWARTTRDADTLEEIYICCLDALDREIVDLRLQGLSGSEIARAFRKSGMRDARAKVGLRLTAIRKRYEQRCTAENERGTG